MAYDGFLFGILWTHEKRFMPTFPQSCLLGYSILNSVTWLNNMVHSTLPSVCECVRESESVREWEWESESESTSESEIHPFANINVHNIPNT